MALPGQPRTPQGLRAGYLYVLGLRFALRRGVHGADCCGSGNLFRAGRCGVLLASCCGSSTQWRWIARPLGSLLVEAYSMITVFYDWNTASSLTKRYDCWFQTSPLRRSGLTAQRPTCSMTERYDCWRQALPSRGLAQLDLT